MGRSRSGSTTGNRPRRCARSCASSIREDVRADFCEDWRLYNAQKEASLDELRAHDQEARRAMKHYARLSGLQGAAVERKEGLVWKKGQARTYKDTKQIDPAQRIARDAQDMKDGQVWRTYRVRKGPESQAIRQIKQRQKEFHAETRDALARMRADISAREKARLKELAAPALKKFEKDRVEAYEKLKARHRADRAELRRDQAAGERRPDVLNSLSPQKRGTGAYTGAVRSVSRPRRPGCQPAPSVRSGAQ